MQIWPWLRNDAQPVSPTAFSTSASSRMISAELPPSSRWARLRCRPASSPIDRPTAVEPVNEMTRTCGSVTSASPTSLPPGSIWSTPAGSPASSKIRAISVPPVTAVRGSGLRRTALPSASAGATERMPEDDRHVERRDHRDHAGRELAGHRQPRLLAGEQLADRLAGQRRRLVALLGRDVDRELRHRADRADLADVPVADLRRCARSRGHRPCAAPRPARCAAAPPTPAAPRRRRPLPPRRPRRRRCPSCRARRRWPARRRRRCRPGPRPRRRP